MALSPAPARQVPDFFIPYLLAMTPSQSPACRRLTLAVSLLLATAAQADVRLPSLISDNMVLLQEKPANVWGWADPQEAVSVTLKDK